MTIKNRLDRLEAKSQAETPPVVGRLKDGMIRTNGEVMTLAEFESRYANVIIIEYTNEAHNGNQKPS